MTHTSQRFCLRWNNHQSNLLSVFDQLLHDESFVDVTLAVEGQLLKAHKMVLSACSPYFQALFVSHPDKHPIVILKDVPFADMRSLLDFMYRGEVSVDQDRLTAFLKVAESLRIKGLTEVNEEKCDLPSIASSLLSNSQQQTGPPPPPPSLHRIHLSQPSSSSSSPSNAKRSAPSPSNFSSYAAHGPPDLLEVNMTEHSQNSPSSFSEEQNIGSPEQMITPDISEDCCIKSEPGDDALTPGTSFQDCKSPQLKDSSSSRSQSQTPTNQSERFPPDKCHWKEILKRLKKPEISIRVENDKNAEESGGGGSRRGGESASSKTAGGGSSNNNSYYGVESFASTSAKGDAVWFTDSSQGSQYYMDADNDDMDDDDDAIIKYEYEAVMRSANNASNSSPSGAAGSASSGGGGGGVAAAQQAGEQTKPLDKSSVRRYCVQVAEHLFQCTLCYKTYTHISNFSRHFLSAHHGLRQEIPCPVCYRIFTRRDNMLTHMKQVHRITVTRGLATSLIQKLSAANESGSNSTESQVNSN